jgi:hypothetical protein
LKDDSQEGVKSASIATPEGPSIKAWTGLNRKKRRELSPTSKLSRLLHVTSPNGWLGIKLSDCSLGELFELFLIRACLCLELGFIHLPDFYLAVENGDMHKHSV